MRQLLSLVKLSCHLVKFHNLKVSLHWLKLILRSILKWWQLTFLHSNIRIYFLDTVPSTSPNMLTWKICLAIKSFFSWWSFALFSWQYVWFRADIVGRNSLLGVKRWTLCAVDLCFAVVRSCHLALVSISFLFLFHFICLLHVHCSSIYFDLSCPSIFAECLIMSVVTYYIINLLIDIWVRWY